MSGEGICVDCRLGDVHAHCAKCGHLRFQHTDDGTKCLTWCGVNCSVCGQPVSPLGAHLTKEEQP